MSDDDFDDMLGNLADNVGKDYTFGGKKYRLAKTGASSGDPCFFCGEPPPTRYIYWTMFLSFDGTVGPARFYAQCTACHERPKHVLDAIIANGGKMPD